MASNNFINECKNGAYCNRYGKLEFDGLTITEDNQLVDFSIESGCYDNGDIIGNTYVKKIEANLLDSITDDLVDKNFDVSVGAKFLVNNVETTEYVDLGTYTVEKPTDTQTENRTSFIGYSQLLDNLDKPYSTELDYDNDTITIADVYEELCDNLGLTPESLTFTNSTIEVEGNPFTNGEKNRDVLRSIEKTSCSFVDIDPTTNEISLKWLSSNLDYTFTLDDYSSLEGGKVVYGPINSLIIRNSEVESENVSINDQESIEEYGEHQFVIMEDYFLYDATKRQEAIQDIWDKVHNLTYVDCKLTTLTGKPFLNVGDKIRVYTSENDYFDTYILKHKFTFNGAFMSEIESPVLTQQEVKTKQDISLGEKLRNTQIIVNKQSGEISSVVSSTETINTNLGVQEGRISSLEINTDGLTTTVSSLQTYTNDELDKLNVDLDNYKSLTDDELGQINSKFGDYATKDDLISIENSVNTITTDTYTKTEINSFLVDGSVKKIQTTSLTADENGLTFEKTSSKTKTNINESGLSILDENESPILKAIYDNNLRNTIVDTYRHQVHEYFIMGTHSRFEDYENGTGCFYIS